VVLELAADGKVGDDRDPERSELVGGADSRGEQQVGRAVRTRGQHRLTLRPQHPNLPVELDLDPARPFSL
jgi:hypothetical protein